MGAAAAIGIGAGVSALGGLLGANSQQKAAKTARNDQQNQLALINRLAQAGMQNGANQYQRGLAESLGEFDLSKVGQFGGNDLVTALMQGTGYNAATVDPSAAPAVNLAGLNTGTDALLQALRGGNGKSGAGADALVSMLGDGATYDTRSLLGNAAAVNEDAMRRAVGEAQGSFGSLGGRFGSAGQLAVADTVRQLTNEQALRNSQIDLSAFEAGQGRRLSAAQALLGQEGQALSAALTARGQDLSAAQGNQQTLLEILTGNQSAQNAAAQFGAAAQNSAASQNASAQNATGQFNAQQALAAFGANTQARNQGLSQLLQALNLGNTVDIQNRGVNADLLRIMAGQQSAAANPYAGNNGHQNVGEQLGGLGTIMFLMQNMKGVK